MLRIYKGEKRRLCVTVTSKDALPFQINEARYEIWNCDMNMREAEGTCDVDDHTLSLLMSAQITGLHEVRYYIRIADEEIIRTIYVAVGET